MSWAYSISVFLALYITFTLFCYLMSPIVSMAGFVARCLASYLCFLVCTAYGAILSILLRLVGYAQIAQWAAGRAFKYTMSAATGVTFDLIDPQHHLDTVRPAVFVGNHQTELDVLMLGCIFPKYCSVTAKSSLKMVPFLGWFMALSGTIFIDRKNSKDARQVMAGAADEMRDKRQSVFIFPEGTRSYAKEPKLLPFKKGAFHLAVQAQVPIVPCVAANYSHVLSVKDRIFVPGSIPVKVLDPIPTNGLTTADVNDLVQKTHALMLDEIVSLTAQARGQQVANDRAAHALKASGTDIRVPT